MTKKKNLMITVEQRTNKPANLPTKEDSAASRTKNHDNKPESEPVDREIISGGGDNAAAIAAAPEPKHMLQHSWTFWFDNPVAKARQSTWGSSIRPVHTVSSVQEFWSIYNNVHRPSKLIVGADFYCFKDKVEPKWEDPICANGGRWTVTFSRYKSDNAWLYTLLAMIGEQFDHGDEICGAVINIRGKQEKIALWTKNAANEAAQVSIGRQWKEFLDYNGTIGFIFHEDARRLDRGAKNNYSV